MYACVCKKERKIDEEREREKSMCVWERDRGGRERER